MNAPLLPALPGYDNPQLIAHGATALVFRAIQTTLNRPVAIKVITVDTGSVPVNAARELATTVALSSQPHIVSIIDTGVTQDDRPYIVMEYCEGGSYAAILRHDGPLPVADVLEVGLKIGEALHAAHQVGIVHRDVKPSNILRSRFGPALTDFGIARAPDELGSTLTREMMTPHHASPEALLHQAQSGISDVYSLASTMWTLLVGHPPFVDPLNPAIDMYAFRDRVLHDDLPPMTREDVPAWLLTELHKAMAKLPSARHASALDFVESLRRSSLGLSPSPEGAATPASSFPAPPPFTRAEASTLPAVATVPPTGRAAVSTTGSGPAVPAADGSAGPNPVGHAPALGPAGGPTAAAVAAGSVPGTAGAAATGSAGAVAAGLPARTSPWTMPAAAPGAASRPVVAEPIAPAGAGISPAPRHAQPADPELGPQPADPEPGAVPAGPVPAGAQPAGAQAGGAQPAGPVPDPRAAGSSTETADRSLSGNRAKAGLDQDAPVTPWSAPPARPGPTPVAGTAEPGAPVAERDTIGDRTGEGTGERTAGGRLAAPPVIPPLPAGPTTPARRPAALRPSPTPSTSVTSSAPSTSDSPVPKPAAAAWPVPAPVRPAPEPVPATAARMSPPVAVPPRATEPRDEGGWLGPQPDTVGYHSATPHRGAQPEARYRQPDVARFDGGPTTGPPQTARRLDPTAFDPPPSGRRGAVFAVLVAVTVIAIAGAAVLLLVANDRRGTVANAPPSSQTADPSPTTFITADSVGGPTNVRITEQRGTTVTLTWTDPTNGTVSFVVTGKGPAGEVLEPKVVARGITTTTYTSLSAAKNYCFVVHAIYSADRVANAPELCTKR
jgi:serine/threonine-protein kinase PknK